MTKKCTICKQDLPLSEFNKSARKKDGLQNVCRECNRARSRLYYKENREKHLKDIGERKQQYKDRNRKLIRGIKAANGCAICGEDEVCCLQFHHLDPKKKDFLVSKAFAGDKTCLKTILDEVRKCVCLCANCHFKVHAGILWVDETHLCKIDVELYNASVA